VTARETEEYRALRDTIRERGTARMWMALAGVSVWAALSVALLAFAAWPAATLLPLMVLACTFEVIVALHTGVERVGRYLQVFYEDQDESRSWEQTTMAYGQRFPARGGDPLFAPVIACATFLNFLPVVVLGGVAVEYVVLGAAHLLFVARLVQARNDAAGQRARDLDRFRQLKEAAIAQQR
jgi:hypothetical protein